MRIRDGLVEVFGKEEVSVGEFAKKWLEMMVPYHGEDVIFALNEGLVKEFNEEGRDFTPRSGILTLAVLASKYLFLASAAYQLYDHFF